MLYNTGNYINVEYLGEGSQATVLSAVNCRTNKHVAIKIYDSKNMNCLREVRMLKKLQKLKIQHSVQYVETFIEKDKLFIVTEFVKGEELHDYLISGKIISITDLKVLFKKILVAVHELHENDICHLDLKLENIMIEPKSGEIKLIDFGFAESTVDETTLKEKMINKYRGSVHYSAPEIIRNVPFDGKKADIWSLGVLFYVLVAEKFPFPGINNPNNPDASVSVATQILHNDISFDGKFTFQMVQLIESMMNRDPTKRGSIKSLLQHSIFAGI